MSEGLLVFAYLAAALLFVMSLAGLSRQESAKSGSLYGMVGMAIAVLATLAHAHITGITLVTVLMIVGAGIGLFLAKKVEMTEMPQLVAILNGFGGLAAVLIGFSSAIEGMEVTVIDSFVSSAEAVIHDAQVAFGVIVGAITFSGSVVACLKLHGRISSRPVSLPGGHWANLAIIGLAVLMAVVYVQQNSLLAFAAHDSLCVRIWYYAGDGHRWCGYAGGGVHVECVFRYRSGCDRFHAG